MGLLDTSLTGLLTAQRSLAVTSHNIANVNTAGYSRQLVNYNAREASFTGMGFIGNGVEITTIFRARDEFLLGQLRNSVTAESQASTSLLFSSRLDSMLADQQTSIGHSLQEFFNAVQDVADVPADTTSRQLLLARAESLASRFQFTHSRLSELYDEIRISLGESLTGINTLADNIASINNRIVTALGEGDGQPPNDLLDIRDQLIKDLSKLVSVSTSDQVDGSINAFIGNGQPLVIGSNASTMALGESYLGNFTITLTDDFNSLDITNSISGGSIGGTFSFIRQELQPAINNIGRIAAGVGIAINNQHRLGINLDSEINMDFFSVGVPEVLQIGSAPNNVTAAITDTSALTTSDYELTYTGGNTYNLVRLQDGQVTNINTGGASPFTTTAVDGFELTITAGAAVNDSYIIRPTGNMARDISLAISDPRKIAAAGILNARENTNVAGIPTNSGTATISPVQITSTAGLPLAGPVTLTYDAALNQFNVSAPPGGTLAYDPATDSNGKQFTLAGTGNATFTIAGTPVDGDIFEIHMVSSDGDNRNALLMGDLQNSKLLQNGTASFGDSYNQLVAEVGSATRQNEISKQALGALLEQAESLNDSISGVNLEEEAANMLRYQHAFQAAAQMIRTADNVFQTLFNAFS